MFRDLKMKELVSSLSQATANRLKTPILGSFILAWLACNHIYVIEFLFSDSKDKVALVKSLAFDFWSDLAFPAFIAVLYTFVLPWLQHQIDELKHAFIDDKRIRSKHTRDKSKYESLGGAAKAQAESSLEYQKDKLGRDLDKWEEQRNNLEEKVAQLNEEVAHQTQLRQDAEINARNIQSQLDSSSESLQHQDEQNRALMSNLENLKKIHNSIEEHYRALKTQTRSHSGILDLIANLDIDETKSLRDHYLDNPNFRALAQARDINSSEYINELLKHDHVVEAVLNHLYTRNDGQLKEILSGMGYVYAPIENAKDENVSLSNQRPIGLAGYVQGDVANFADVVTKLPLYSEYGLNSEIPASKYIQEK